MITPKELIAYYTAKLANQDLTPGSRKVASATLERLTAMQAEIEIKESTMAGYRRENMMLYTENKIKDEALTAMRAENTKLYADLCEMGDMARERSRRRDAVIGIDLAGGVDYTVDHLIRHKWPEEKPEKPAKYMIRVEYDDNGAIVSETTTDEWNGFNWYEYLEDHITHWWNLPVVTE